ncbi:hypothetical protein PFISCL1PPCAC_20305, partial [Pristionchus fissidentatus]
SFVMEKLSQTEQRIRQLEMELEASKEETNRYKLELEMSSSSLKTANTEIAQIRRQLAIRDVELAQKEEEMRGFATTLKTVVALKNKKIKELELKLLESQRGEEPAAKKRKIGERGDEEENEFDVPTQPAVQINQKVLNFNEEKNQSKIPLEFIPSRTIHARFDNISTLTEAGMLSSYVTIEGAKWSIHIWKHVAYKTYLAVYLDLVIDRDIPSLSWTVFDRKHLCPHDLNKKSHSSEWANACTYNSKFSSWGRNEFICVKDLFDPKNGFIKDNAIIIALELCNGRVVSIGAEDSTAREGIGS